MVSKLLQKQATEAEKKKVKARRKRRLTILGAAIVLVTFAVREAFREQLKQLSDSIAAAQTIESATSAKDILAHQQLQLSLLQREVAADHADAKHAGVISKMNLQAEIGDLRQQYYTAAEHVENISTLQAKLPKMGEAAIHLKDHQNKVKKSQKSVQEAVEATIQANSASQPTWKNHEAILVEMVHVQLFEVMVVVWGAEVLSVADTVKQAADTLYSFCTWASYFLYALGAGVALFAQLAE